VSRNAIVSLAEVTHDELDFVHHTPRACDPASQPQGPLQITDVESDSPGASRRHSRSPRHVIGKDVRIGPQRLHHLRGEDFIRQSGPGDDDLSARRLITRLRDRRLRQGYHPASSQPYSQRYRKE
jgi:hypothetical protein